MGRNVSDDEWRGLTAAVKRVARARGLDESTSDDVAQETLTRLIAAADRLEPTARLPYALTTAGNLIVSMYRKDDTARRHQHRLLEVSEPPRPEAEVLAVEEAAALRTALNEVNAKDRQLLVDHAEGSTTTDLATADGSSPGAIAARLSRTRARLRLDYLLALRRVELPTAACRAVLLAVSASDRRRQQALDAAGHFATCTTCVELIPALSERKSALAGVAVAPVVALGGFGGWVARIARRGTVQAVSGVVVVAVAAGAYATAPDNKAPNPAPKEHAAPAPVVPSPLPARIRTVAGVNLIPLPSVAVMKALIGQRVIVQGVLVQSVVSHPGFWIGTANDRLYVELEHVDVAKPSIRRGRHVSFVAVLRANPVNYAEEQGVAAAEGAGLLTSQGEHLSVDFSQVSQR